jgi:phage N-6-adenine-methyltransferase
MTPAREEDRHEGGQIDSFENQRLEVLEGIIERGRQTFIEVGEALLEIRDSRLYRAGHLTFEDYCRERWGFMRDTGDRLIAAAEVALALTPIGVSPTNEAQARELAPLRGDPEAMREVWQETLERVGPEPTARDIRETRMGVHYSSATPEWETPQALFDLLDAEFGFDLDVCATAENAKCERYFDAAADGLSQSWQGVCWMNPPYGDEIAACIAKAHSEAERGAVVVCLVPARTDTAWFWDHARYGEVRFLRGRLRFGGGETGAPFPSALVIFGFPAKVIWWEAWPVISRRS